jgi:hypothetical protein
LLLLLHALLSIRLRQQNPSRQEKHKRNTGASAVSSSFLLQPEPDHVRSLILLELEFS